MTLGELDARIKQLEVSQTNQREVFQTPDESLYTQLELVERQVAAMIELLERLFPGSRQSIERACTNAQNAEEETVKSAGERLLSL